MRIGAGRTRLRSGQTAHVPAGVTHASTALGSDTGRRILLFKPAGLERFFREVGAASPDAIVDSRLAVEAAIRHGWQFEREGRLEVAVDCATAGVVIRPARTTDLPP